MEDKGINIGNIHVTSHFLAIMMIPLDRPVGQFNHVLRQLVYKSPGPHFVELGKLCFDCFLPFWPFPGSPHIFQAHCTIVCSNGEGLITYICDNVYVFIFVIREGII